MSRMDYVDWQEASDTLNSLAEHGLCVSDGRPYRLVVGGRIVGRFSTLSGAHEEETRLHRLAMKDGRQIDSHIETN